MAQLFLPRNSRIKGGKKWKLPKVDEARRVRKRTFRVYRWGGEQGERPRVDRYTIDLNRCGADGSRRVDCHQEYYRSDAHFSSFVS